ncbi:hypothetical protein L292_0556 [Acinetobacter junii CIP 107470 = MTCC 11364]|uniref:MobC n=1 Tax=Acinetobacter junii CIP 107470 = MTCC 11364 TaxID=1217666 RepID=S7Y4Z4_ACIJU|nr:hypothetical protein [Acinetobacter junii]ENV52054.1 hypothetical protein F953_00544 [Acinetobacter junii CIP 107470 = MTCC 11364]EPR83078.1 hypothetical protein L292_0556 [Acinetobacter junii CIP 107470 = MTCC 11364]
MSFTKEQILELEKKLSALPEHKKIDNLNKLESLRLMHVTIIDLKNKGYSNKLIADLLTQNDFEISANLLTSYLSIIKKKRSKKPKKLVKNDNKIIQDNGNNIENMPTIETSKESATKKSEIVQKNSMNNTAFVNIADSEKL